MVWQMHSTKQVWVFVPKKQQQILKSQDKPKINTANNPIKDISKQSKKDFSQIK